MSNYKDNSWSDKFSWIITVIAMVLVAILSIGLLCALFIQPQEDDSDKTKQTEQAAVNEQAGGGDVGAVIGKSAEHGIKLMSAKITPSDYAVNGISPTAETAYTLTATIEPSNADNKEVDWSVAFVDPSSSWASGKTVTDYVTVTPTLDGALTANVECKQAFGEQIKVTVTSRENANASASCMVDYAQRVTGMAAGHVFSMWNTTSDSEVELSEFAGFLSEEDMKDSFFCIPSFSDVYTKADDFTYTVTYTQPEEYRDATGKFTGWHGGPTATMVYSGDIGEDGDVPVSSVQIGGIDTSKIGYGKYILMSFMIESVTGESDPSFASTYNNCLQILKSNPDMPVMQVHFQAEGQYSSYSKTINLTVSAEALQVLVESASLSKSELVF